MIVDKSKCRSDRVSYFAHTGGVTKIIMFFLYAC